MATYVSASPLQTEEMGERLGKTLRGGELVVFSGGLGVGKTTFCKGLAKGLGCEEIVTSPTFAIANVYAGRVTLAHFDAYRITSEEDLETAGFYDYLEQGAVVAVEWSENILAWIREPMIKVTMSALDEARRGIEIEGAGGL